MALTQSAPYDCESIYEVDDDLAVLPCVDHGPRWFLMSRQVLWGFAIWFIIVLLSKRWSKVWLTYCDDSGNPPLWAQRYVGTPNLEPLNKKLVIVLELGQLVSCAVNIYVWVVRSYALKTVYGNVDIFFTLLSCVHSVFLHIKWGFSVQYCYQLSAIIDCLTIPGILLQGWGPVFGGSWLTFAYLRAYAQLTAFNGLCELGVFDLYLTDFAKACIVKTLECVMVVFSIAGTMWILEGLGDVEGYADQYMLSGMGEISFFQMVYFTFMTISTVGYGDYAPTTVFSRTFIVFATLGGVSFFSFVSVQMYQLQQLEASGAGRYLPSREAKRGRGHILVIGGGVDVGSAVVMETFLKALCRKGSGTNPDVVIMSQTPISSEVKEMLNNQWAKSFNILFFVGSPLDAGDMKRVRCKSASMVFIITDFQTNDTVAEDNNNILLGIHFQKSFPMCQFRLMLAGIPALTLAIHVGLSEYNCFSIEAFKSSMMATSIRCPGFSTLLLNLGLPDLPDPDNVIETHKNCSAWIREYVEGCGLEVYGFSPAPSFYNSTFKQAALRLADLDLLLIAMHVDGSIRLNPSDAVIDAATVLFAIAADEEALNPVCKFKRSSVSTWIGQFQANRKAGGHAARQRAKHIKLQSPAALARVFAASANPNFSAEDRIHNNSILNGNLSGAEEMAAFLEEEDSFTTFRESSPVNKFKESDLFSYPPAHGQKPSPRRAETKFEDMDEDRFKRPPMLGKGGFHAPLSQRLNRNSPMTAQERRASFSSQNVKELMKSTKKELIEKLKRESQPDSNLERLMNVVEQGGHTVLLMMMDDDLEDLETLWHQLELIVSIERDTDPDSPMVVVYEETSRPANIRPINAADAIFVVGHPLDIAVLEAAGVQVCARLITLAPSAPPMKVLTSSSGHDEANILLAVKLEQHLALWGRDDLEVVFDFYSPNSLKYLPVPTERKESAKQKSKSFRDKEALQMAADGSYAQEDPRGDSRFAAGHILPKPLISAMFSMAYYTPGVLELLEGLMNPNKYDQESMTWALPATPGKTYKQLAWEILESGAVPIGVFRHPHLDSGARLPFVVASTPGNEMMLRSGDTVYTLAPKRWAAEHGLYPTELLTAKDRTPKHKPPPQSKMPAQPIKINPATVPQQSLSSIPVKHSAGHVSKIDEPLPEIITALPPRKLSADSSPPLAKDEVPFPPPQQAPPQPPPPSEQEQPKERRIEPFVDSRASSPQSSMNGPIKEVVSKAQIEKLTEMVSSAEQRSSPHNKPRRILGSPTRQTNSSEDTPITAPSLSLPMSPTRSPKQRPPGRRFPQVNISKDDVKNMDSNETKDQAAGFHLDM